MDNLSSQQPLLRMTEVCKKFPGVSALDKVSISILPGEVRALVGENGAGKSTLMKILAGACIADEGTIEIDGSVIASPTPSLMLELGIAVIYQELAQAPHLTVAENIFLGRLPSLKPGVVNWQKAKKESIAVMNRLGFYVDPDARIDQLSVAERQMVEIARAVSRNARLIVLDEPSAVLGGAELIKLFEIIRSLRKEGVSFIYISHRLVEVFEISQSVTVLRDGELIETCQIDKLTTDGLIRMMVGRELTDIFPTRKANISDAPALQIEGLTRDGVLNNISFEVRAGEIVGVCGLAAAGRTELLRAIVGADPIDSGVIKVGGDTVVISTPRKALAIGLGLLPEDRKTEGLFLDQSLGFNATIAKLKKFISKHFLNVRAERRVIADYVKRLHIKAPSIDVRVGNLSGGNQQKCVLAKLLNARCQVLLVDEPTRGVDVGAKREIYDLLAELTENHGVAIVMVSSELPEVLGMSDRILVMREGTVSAELDRSQATEELIMTHATVH